MTFIGSKGVAVVGLCWCAAACAVQAPPPGGDQGEASDAGGAAPPATTSPTPGSPYVPTDSPPQGVGGARANGGAGGSAAGGDPNPVGSMGGQGEGGTGPETGGADAGGADSAGGTANTGGQGGAFPFPLGGTGGCPLFTDCSGGAGGTPAAGGSATADECANETCFDIFDCYLYFPNAAACGFTKCENFICMP